MFFFCPGFEAAQAPGGPQAQVEKEGALAFFPAQAYQGHGAQTK